MKTNEQLEKRIETLEKELKHLKAIELIISSGFIYIKTNMF